MSTVARSEANPVIDDAFGAESPNRETPRVAVVVISSEAPADLRPWLGPVVSECSARDIEIVLVRESPIPDLTTWGPEFDAVRLVMAPGDSVARRRAGVAATRADVLLITEDTDRTAHHRLITLAEALGLRHDV